MLVTVHLNNSIMGIFDYSENTRRCKANKTTESTSSLKAKTIGISLRRVQFNDPL